MASIRPILLPLVVALGAVSCSSVDFPAFGGSEDATASTPAWLKPAVSDPAQAEQQDAPASDFVAADPGAAQQPAEDGNAFHGETSIVETSFGVSAGWDGDVAERLDRIEATASGIAGDLRNLNRQIGSIAAEGVAQADQSAAAAAAIGSLASEFADFAATLADFEAQIQGLNAAIAANATALANVRTDLRNVSTSVSGSITPAVELGLGTTGGWFKTTLIVTIVGFACVGFFLWRFSQRSATRGQ